MADLADFLRTFADWKARNEVALPPGGRLIAWPGQKPGLPYLASSTTTATIMLPGDTSAVAVVTTSGFTSLQAVGQPSGFQYLNLGQTVNGDQYVVPFSAAIETQITLTIATDVGEDGVLYVVAFPAYLPRSANAPSIPLQRWNINNSPAAGSQASAAQAGASGVTHVADSFQGALNQTGTTNNNVALQVLDGATVLFQLTFGLLATTGSCTFAGPFGPGMNFRGTPGNAMTVRWAVGRTGFAESVNLNGVDQ